MEGPAPDCDDLTTKRERPAVTGRFASTVLDDES